MTQSGDAVKNSLRYRSYLPRGIALAVVVPAVIPLIELGIRTEAPSYLVSSSALILALLVLNVFPVRDAVLSSNGRLTVTGLGQRIDVDARHFTEISVSTRARWGFGFAHVRWDGGGFRMWPAMTFTPDPCHWFRKGRPYRSVSRDFQDLVFRLHLTNPAMRIRGVEPPRWAISPPTPRLPAPHRYEW